MFLVFVEKYRFVNSPPIFHLYSYILTDVQIYTYFYKHPAISKILMEDLAFINIVQSSPDILASQMRSKSRYDYNFVSRELSIRRFVSKKSKKKKIYIYIFIYSDRSIIIQIFLKATSYIYKYLISFVDLSRIEKCTTIFYSIRKI